MNAGRGFGLSPFLCERHPMLFRFIGQYTNGRTSICMNGVTFDGHEPVEVPEALAFRFAGNAEFEAVEQDAPVDKPKRGRSRKVDQ